MDPGVTTAPGPQDCWTVIQQIRQPQELERSQLHVQQGILCCENRHSNHDHVTVQTRAKSRWNLEIDEPSLTENNKQSTTFGQAPH